MKKILNYTNRKDQITISGENPEVKINITEERGEILNQKLILLKINFLMTLRYLYNHIQFTGM